MEVQPNKFYKKGNIYRKVITKNSFVTVHNSRWYPTISHYDYSTGIDDCFEGYTECSSSEFINAFTETDRGIKSLMVGGNYAD